MRPIGFLVLPTLLTLVVVLTVLVIGHLQRAKRCRADQSARWQDRVVTHHGTTLIVIQRVVRRGDQERVLDKIVMGQVAADDTDWTSKVRAARNRAADRAFELNVQSFTGPP